MAVEHSILVIAYHVIKRQEPYHELGGNYFDNRRPEATAKHLVKRLEQLGYEVTIQQGLPVSLSRRPKSGNMKGVAGEACPLIPVVYCVAQNDTSAGG